MAFLQSQKVACHRSARRGCLHPCRTGRERKDIYPLIGVLSSVGINKCFFCLMDIYLFAFSLGFICERDILKLLFDAYFSFYGIF